MPHHYNNDDLLPTEPWGTQFSKILIQQSSIRKLLLKKIGHWWSHMTVVFITTGVQTKHCVHFQLFPCYRAWHIHKLSLAWLPKFYIFQLRLYMILKKTLPKSTCPIGNFTCPWLSKLFIRQLSNGLYIYILFKFVEFPVRHLGLAIGNVRCVRWFSWTLGVVTPTPGPGVNTGRPEQNGHNSADNIFKLISVNKNICILIQISMNLFPKGPTDN